MRNSNSRRSARTVPFILNGASAKINPDDLQDWRRYSGKSSDGVVVNSIAATTIGDSILLKHSEGGPVFSVTKHELDVFVKTYMAEGGVKPLTARA